MIINLLFKNYKMFLEEEYILFLKEKFDFYNQIKDEIVEKGIKINRFSKSIIYALIRNDIETAEKYINQFKDMMEDYKKLVNLYPQFWKNAEISYQEYAEAMIFYSYLKENKIPTHKDLELDETSYIQWLMDFTWELLRKATEELINGNIDFAKKAKNTIEEIYLALLNMELKNFDLRKKLDYVAANLNRLQDKIFYYLTLRIQPQ